MGRLWVSSTIKSDESKLGIWELFTTNDIVTVSTILTIIIKLEYIVNNILDGLENMPDVGVLITHLTKAKKDS